MVPRLIAAASNMVQRLVDSRATEEGTQVRHLPRLAQELVG
jgi:hypothetical protein